jgi:pentatricopeptide repeat protein
MEATGCTPDVVTYTSLISAYERGGQWHLALQAFQRMLAHGCRPDAIVYNAIIDALWQTGVVWAQVRARLGGGGFAFLAAGAQPRPRPPWRAPRPLRPDREALHPSRCQPAAPPLPSPPHPFKGQSPRAVPVGRQAGPPPLSPAPAAGRARRRRRPALERHRLPARGFVSF